MGRILAFVVLGVVAVSALTAAAAQIKELQWQDLVGTYEFEDPFESLTSEQILDFGTYVRVTVLKETDPAMVNQNMEDEAREARSRL